MRKRLKLDIFKQYNHQAKSYANSTLKYNRYSRKLFYNLIDSNLKNKNLLDIGFGEGYDFIEYSKRGAILNGVDSGEEFVKNVKRRFPSANIKLGKMEKLPFKDNSMDYVVSKYAIQTSKNIPRVLREITRVLKPNGILVYLAVHPMRQFLEKKKNKNCNYFLQEIVESKFFEGKITAKEPSHTMNEYLSEEFFKNYKMLLFTEQPEFPAAERINGHNYPVFFIVKARKYKNGPKRNQT